MVSVMKGLWLDSRNHRRSTSIRIPLKFRGNESMSIPGRRTLTGISKQIGLDSSFKKSVSMTSLATRMLGRREKSMKHQPTRAELVERRALVEPRDSIQAAMAVILEAFIRASAKEHGRAISEGKRRAKERRRAAMGHTTSATSAPPVDTKVSRQAVSVAPRV